jgi:hypothetical protein
MKPVDIVNDLLEGYPGASHATLDEIMGIIRSVASDLIKKQVSADFGVDTDNIAFKPNTEGLKESVETKMPHLAARYPQLGAGAIRFIAQTYDPTGEAKATYTDWICKICTNDSSLLQQPYVLTVLKLTLADYAKLKDTKIFRESGGSNDIYTYKDLKSLSRVVDSVIRLKTDREFKANSARISADTATAPSPSTSTSASSIIPADLKLSQFFRSLPKTVLRDTAKFVDAVNPLLDKFRIKFSVNWQDIVLNIGFERPQVALDQLIRFSVQGFHHKGWCYVLAPKQISLSSVEDPKLRSVIEHEMVHQDQYSKIPVEKREEVSANNRQVFAKKKNRYTRLDYLSSKIETPAHAKSLVNNLRSKVKTKNNVLQLLKRPIKNGPYFDRNDYDKSNALKQGDPKAYKRFLKHAAGYAEQLPESMKPEYIVDTLLESLPGMSQAELDEIMNIVRSVVDRVKSGNPQVDVPRFEQEVNPLLEPYRVKFSSNDPMLMKYHMPARAGLDGAIVQTPSRISRDGFSNVPLMLSHELVHVDQMSRAFHGNAMKMYQSAHDRILPGGKFDHQAYQTDPHEVTAYARSLIDQMRSRKGTKDQALAALKSGAGNRLKNVDTKSHHRFLKAAAGYAQDLPSK